MFPKSILRKWLVSRWACQRDMGAVWFRKLGHHWSSYGILFLQMGNLGQSFGFFVAYSCCQQFGTHWSIMTYLQGVSVPCSIWPGSLMCLDFFLRFPQCTFHQRLFGFLRWVFCPHLGEWWMERWIPGTDMGADVLMIVPQLFQPTGRKTWRYFFWWKTTQNNIRNTNEVRTNCKKSFPSITRFLTCLIISSEKTRVLSRSGSTCSAMDFNTYPAVQQISISFSHWPSGSRTLCELLVVRETANWWRNRIRSKNNSCLGLSILQMSAQQPSTPLALLPRSHRSPSRCSRPKAARGHPSTTVFGCFWKST